MATRALEIRINSIQDAQSVVQNQIVISRHLKETGLDALHFKVAEEVQAMAMPLLAGVLSSEKRFFTYIKVDDESQIFILPKLIEAPAAQAVQEPASTDKPFALPDLSGLTLDQLKALKVKSKVVFGNKMAKVQSRINELS